MDRFDQLTPRERECLLGVTQFKQSKTIATDLGLMKATVDKHIGSAKRKLRANTRGEAAWWLVQHLQDAGLPIEYQGRPIRLAYEPFPHLHGAVKGGPHAPLDAADPGDHLGGSGGGLRRPGDDTGGEGHRPFPSDDDAIARSQSLSDRSHSRGYLHRFRAESRKRPASPRVDLGYGLTLGVKLIKALGYGLGATVIILVGSAVILQGIQHFDGINAWLDAR